MDFDKKVGEAAKNLQYAVENNAKMMANIADWREVFRKAGVDLSEYSGHMRSWEVWDGVLEIHLSEEHRDSRIAHAIARGFGCEVTKEKSWSGESLIERAKVDDRHTIVIYGYVPETCKVSFVEEPIPEDQIVRTRKKAVMDCGPGNGEKEA